MRKSLTFIKYTAQWSSVKIVEKEKKFNKDCISIGNFVIKKQYSGMILKD